MNRVESGEGDGGVPTIKVCKGRMVRIVGNDLVFLIEVDSTRSSVRGDSYRGVSDEMEEELLVFN